MEYCNADNYRTNISQCLLVINLLSFPELQFSCVNVEPTKLGVHLWRDIVLILWEREESGDM